MANRFFTNVIDLITGGKARATEVEANFTSVEVGFDALATEYDATLAGLQSLKAAKAGDTYTGTHNFTGATINVPTAPAGVAGDKAVNMTALLNAIAGLFTTQLTVQVVTGTSQTAAVGTFYVFTNVAECTLTLPTPTGSGELIGVLFTNGLASNVLARTSGNICGVPENMTLDTRSRIGRIYRDLNSSWEYGT